MEWIDNNIEKAVSKSKENKSLFIVLTEEDNTSEGEVWQNEKIKEIVHKNNCVLVRLKANSTTAVQFNQIYPVVTCPTVYFIGNNGKALEVKAGQTTTLDLLNSFNKALKLHSISVGASKTSSTAPLKPHQELSNSSQKLLQSSSSQSPIVSSDTKAPFSAHRADNTEREADDKDASQRGRIQVEIEEARKLKNSEYQMLKDKMRAKDEKMKIENDRKMNEEMGNKEILKNKVARIQFKLPDGSTIVRAFDAEDKLLLARQFIVEHLHGRVRNIKMSKLRPNLIIEDLEQSFTHYNLVPSSVLLVFFDDEPKSNTSSNLNSIFAFWAKFILILQYLLSWIIPSSPNQPSIPSSQPSSSTPESLSNTQSTARPKSSNKNKGLKQRKEGNVHRLTADDEDDDLATWNGNSTQQM